VLRDAVSGGPVRSQAEEVLAMLADEARCRVMLVCAPETTPIKEMIDTAYDLEERVGVRLSPVVVNGIDTAPAEVLGLDDAALVGLCDDGATLAAARHRLARIAAHAAAIAELERSFPLPHIDVPRVPASAEAELVARCADAIAESVADLSGAGR
jgi:hypothetical protein